MLDYGISNLEDHRNIEGIKEDTVDIEKSSNIASNDNQRYILGNNIYAENPMISHTTVQSVPTSKREKERLRQPESLNELCMAQQFL